MERVSAAAERAAPWLAAAALGLAALMPVYNADTFGHIAAGREIAALGAVPHVDHFSLMFDAPQPWRNHNWLSGLLLYAIDVRFGVNGLVAFGVVLSAAAAWVLVRCASALLPGTGAGLSCAILSVAAIPAVRIRLSPRPHMFSLLFEAVLLSVLITLSATPSARPRLRVLLLLAALQIAWVNLHGSSPLGLVMTAIFLALNARSAPARRELAMLLGLQLLGSCITPFGPALLLESVRHVGDPAVAATLSEWGAFDASDPAWYMASLALQGGLLLLSAFSLRSQGLAFHGCFALSFLLWFMGLRSSRFVLDALLVGAPCVAVGLARLATQWTPRVRHTLALAASAAALVIAPVASAGLPPYSPIALGSDGSMLPETSGAWLAQHHPHARIAAAIGDAWYLSYAVPDSRVLIDGRVAVYGIQAMERVHAAFARPDVFMQLCAQHRIDAVVLQHALRAQAQAVAAIAASRDFRLVQLDDHYALFVRASVAPEQPAFVSLHPGFAVLAPGPESEPMRQTSAELARLAQSPAARGYYAYHSALALLAPYLQARGHDGLRPALDAAGREAVSRALPLLRLASERLPDVPIVHVYHALVAARSCALPEARAALQRATALGPSREASLIAQEVALRARETASVRDFLGQVSRVPDLAADPWIASLRGELAEDSACR